MKEFFEIALMVSPFIVAIFQIGERLGRLEVIVAILKEELIK